MQRRHVSASRVAPPLHSALRGVGGAFVLGRLCRLRSCLLNRSGVNQSINVANSERGISVSSVSSVDKPRGFSAIPLGGGSGFELDNG